MKFGGFGVLCIARFTTIVVRFGEWVGCTITIVNGLKMTATTDQKDVGATSCSYLISAIDLFRVEIDLPRGRCGR